MPPNTVSVTRPGIMGNPFPVDCYGQAGAVDLYRRWLTGNMSSREMSELSRCDKWSSPPTISLVSVRQWVREEIPKLRGKNLVCWCSLDKPCHADVLLELANKVIPIPEERPFQ